jgi:transcriptional regulator with XRE-family HTH domain
LEFKNRLKQLRLEKDMYQKDVAKILGIAQTTYSGYETGAREPDLNTLIKIANLFECDVDYLIGFSNEKKGSINDNQYTVVIEKAKLSKIKPSDLVELIEMIQKFQKN